MKNILEKAFAGLMMATSLQLIGDPVVKSVEAHQRYPWNGKVDITVTIEGSPNDVAEAECYFVATNSATKVAIQVAHIEQCGSDTGYGTTWTRRFVWDCASDVGEVKVDDVILVVEASPDVQLWENGPYWAKCNVGASKPEEYGYYFWWGDTVGYKRNASNNGWISAKDGSSFKFSLNCPTYGMDNSSLLSAGYIDSSGNLAAEHDAATVHLGSPWRVPTGTEISALISNCDKTWIVRNGVYGRLITGRGAYSSKSIFLPAAGRGSYSDVEYADSDGDYLSSTPNSYLDCRVAWYLAFSTWYFGLDFDGRRYYGKSVRPVRDFAK